MAGHRCKTKASAKRMAKRLRKRGNKVSYSKGKKYWYVSSTK